MINFGICGCGDFIKYAVLPMMNSVENAKAVAAFDTDKDRLGAVCEEFDIPSQCATFEDLLKIDSVDAIYVASPNVFHRPQTIAAAEAGKHVFCQKPMGMTAAECREMIAACKRNGVKLAMGFCYPLQGAQQRAKELVKEGTIGEVSHLHISFNLPGYNPETVGWRCNPKLSGGGPLMDIAPHLINLACFFCEDKVESVMAYIRPERTDTQIETDVTAILQFSRGARATIDTSFVRGDKHNYILAGTSGEIRAVGTMAWRTGGSLTMRRPDEVEDIPFSMTEHIEEERRCAPLHWGRRIACPSGHRCRLRVRT